LQRHVGHYSPVSPARRLICDLLHFASKVPTVPVQRSMQLDELAQARDLIADHWPGGSPKPRWPALFLKAFALTASEMPALRQALIRWPWERMYEHPHSVVSVAISKPSKESAQGEEVLFGHIHHPETLTLGEIETRLRQFKERPAKEFGVMRRAMRIARLPRFLRRLLCAGLVGPDAGQPHGNLRPECLLRVGGGKPASPFTPDHLPDLRPRI
jgi:hypothetical protein